MCEFFFPTRRILTPALSHRMGEGDRFSVLLQDRIPLAPTLDTSLEEQEQEQDQDQEQEMRKGDTRSTHSPDLPSPRSELARR
jgi:hypothetical protein